MLGFVGQGLAVDRYKLEVPRAAMAGDPDVTVAVIPLTGAAVDPTPHAISFVGLPRGVALTPMAPSASLTVAGSTLFHVILDPSLAGQRVAVRVQNGGDKAIVGSAVVVVEKTVDHFAVTPAGMAAPRVGVPFRFQILALDQDGAVVRSFNDPLDVKALYGSVENAAVSGDSFAKGVAFVDVTFGEADPPGRLNRLTVQANILYPGQAERAAGFVDLSILPPEANR